MLDVVCVCVCMLGSEVTRWGGKTPELRATSSNQSGALSFLKETSVHPNRCNNCLMRLIENQCISVSLAASVLRLEMHAELLGSGDVQKGLSQQGAAGARDVPG